MDFLGIDETHFLQLVEKHVVDPHVMPSADEVTASQPNKVLHDFNEWPRVVGIAEKDVPGK